MSGSAHNGGVHTFGGDWTTRKLEIVQSYLRAYTQVMKKQPFRTAYIDAFAGTGRRRPSDEADDAAPLFDFSDFHRDAKPILDGSARMALGVEPPFDRYIFMEADPVKCEALRAQADDFPQRSLDVQCGDANDLLQALAAKDWRKHRAVLFLDPYGMQVAWSTMKAVAATRAIDVWVLFPLGVATQRLLQRDGNVPPGWAAALTRIFGTEAWRDEFYQPVQEPALFDVPERLEKTATSQSIASFYKRRLSEEFPVVAPNHVLLRNSTGCPLYMLCFAAGSPGKGGDVALRIADHILKKEL